MKKVRYLLYAALASLAMLTVSCQDPNPQPQEDDPIDDPVELEALKYTVQVTSDWVYSGKPDFTITIENPNEVDVKVELKGRISTDKGKVQTTISNNVEVPAKSSKDFSLTGENLDPGFYRVYITANGDFIRQFVFGIDPTKIVSAPDMQTDFNDFWETAIKQLEAIDMKADLTEITAKSSADAKVYLVELQSVPDGLSGDPVIMRGYLVEPQDGKPHPVLMHYFGWDDGVKRKLSCPSGGSKPQFTEFYVSTRGQMINNRVASLREPDGHGDFVNPYGDWFASGFGDKNSYYYRGAFMDCVQAIRFMATRPASDMKNVFAEGSSQGGAFSYAAAALSPYTLRAIAPGVAFLGDFPDYFDIVGWPANTARASQGSMSDEEMYAFLSYFDTKNLATRISATAVIACSSLQDGTCPPHTNLAPYNNLVTKDKVIYFNPNLAHEVSGSWYSEYMKFFKDRIVE